jgi:MFS family permease
VSLHARAREIPSDCRRIVLRAFQGIGGSGTYSVTVAIFFELVPPARFAFTTSLISAIFALAFLVGPLLGGAITQFSSWKWVFLLKYALLLPRHNAELIMSVLRWACSVSRS